MNRLFQFVTTLLFVSLATNLMATDYLVSGAGTTAVNGIYIPDGTNEYGAPRWKQSGGSYYLHSDGMYSWYINNNSSYPFSNSYYNNTNAPFSQSVPPFTGWNKDLNGTSPAPTIGEAAPTLSYSSSTFTESAANNGTINNSQPILITHNNFEGGTFTGTNGDNFVTASKVVVTNLPAGLTAVITRTSATTLSATITGTASSHNNVNDVSNLTFSFQNSAFSTGNAAGVFNSTKSDLKVNFIQTYTVASSGGDYSTLEAAISASSAGDILNVSAGAFTENELVIDKDLTIQGQGAGSTFIQAAATYNTATHRVFTINAGITATIKNVTIRYGRYALSGSGAGIRNNGNLTLQNADVSYNVFGNWGNGGGITNYGTLVVDNCAIHHNIAYVGGGLLLSDNGTATITNSTITENSAVNDTEGPYFSNLGGGIYLQGSLVLTNSTITRNVCINNEAFGPSSGLCNNYADLTIFNTIIADNETSDYKVQYGVGTITDNGHNIVKYQGGGSAGWFLTATTNIFYNYMANQSPSTSWNRNNAVLANQNLNISSSLGDNGTLNGTQTLALLSGSFAIDAGNSTGAPATDQRGLLRNGTTDIGAFEFGATVPPPSAQPTNLYFSTTTSGGNNIVLHYTASATAQKYLIVRKTGSEPTFVPSNGTEYSIGAQGADQIIYVGSDVMATDASVTSDVSYYYKIYAYNGSSSYAGYLTTNPLNGSSTLYSSTGSVPTTSANISAGFPNAGVTTTFPNGTTGTTLTVTKTSATPAANFSALPGVRGVKNLYFTITSSNASPGSFILVLDFSSLGLTQTQWNNFKIMKRANAASAWVDIATLGATIISRQTDGVWGKFTISGLTSFSEFAGGEAATTYTVISAAETGAGTLKNLISGATAGDIILFDPVSMGGSTITLTSPVVIDKDLTIRGSAGGITLNGNNSSSVIQILDTRVVRLENLKIQNGFSDVALGGGVYNSGDLTLINCVVSGNVDTGNEGVGGILQYTAPGDDENDVLNLVNCTVTGNDGTSEVLTTGTGGLLSTSGAVNIYNTIIYGNTGNLYADVDEATTVIAKSYNSLYGKDISSQITAGGSNLYSQNPQFSGSEANPSHPYVIRSSSPCTDAGNDSYSFETTDIRGGIYSRKLNKSTGLTGTIDIGAYEFNAGLIWDGSESQDWNTAANWGTNAVPTASDPVTIPGNGSGVTNWPQVNEAPATPAVCLDLNIESGGMLTIDAGKALTVNGALTNNTGNSGLIMQSSGAGTGSLLHNTAGVPATIKRHITGSAVLTNNTYHLVSIPLTTTSNSTANLFLGSYLYDFNVAGNSWNGLGTSTTTELDETKGYMLYYPGASVLYSFAGNLNAGSFSPSVAYAGSGFNLVPNPYPSAIDWDATTGWTRTNLGGSIWIWSATNGNYAAYNTVSGGTNNGTKYIPAGQAFFVKTTAETPQLVMNNAVRVHNDQSFWKSAETLSDRLRIKAESNGYSDEVIVRFDDNATLYQDEQLDAAKLSGQDNAPQLCTVTADNDQLSINSLPRSAGTVTVPLNFELKTDKMVTFTVSGIETFHPNTRIYLEDKKEGSMIDVRKNPAYTFTHQQGNAAGRFLLHFNGVAGMDDLKAANSTIWVNEQTVYLAFRGSAGENALVEIFSISGQMAFSEQVTLTALTKVQAPLTGVFIIRVTTSKETLTAKGFFN